MLLADTVSGLLHVVYYPGCTISEYDHMTTVRQISGWVGRSFNDSYPLRSGFDAAAASVNVSSGKRGPRWLFGDNSAIENQEHIYVDCAMSKELAQATAEEYKHLNITCKLHSVRTLSLTIYLLLIHPWHCLEKLHIVCVFIAEKILNQKMDITWRISRQKWQKNRI